MSRFPENKQEFSRDKVLSRMATAFYTLLKRIAPLINKNTDVKSGIHEGLIKFLSNVYIACLNKRNTDFYSKKACCKLLNGDDSGLVFEHVVPKKLYQNAIIEDFIKGNIKSAKDIKATLDKFWITATVTDEEHKELHKVKLSKGWEKVNVMARYEDKNISLVSRNDFIEHLKGKR